jgi:hypothetical protein
MIFESAAEVAQKRIGQPYGVIATRCKWKYFYITAKLN